MTQHAISVVPHFEWAGAKDPLVIGDWALPVNAEIPIQATGKHVWRCRCGVSGGPHKEHQKALEHGLAHLKIEQEQPCQQ